MNRQAAPPARRQVVVINQFALPRTEAGGTRHFDLYSRLPNWHTRIIAGDVNYSTHARFTTAEPMFDLIRVPVHERNGIRRILGWIVFFFRAIFRGVRTRADVVVGSSPHLLAPLAAYVVAKLKRAQFVLEIRDLWPESIVAAGMLKPGSVIHRVLVGLERFLYRKASRIIVVINGWEKHFESLGIDTAKLVHIPNGTEPADFAVREDRETLRERYGVTGYTAVFAGAHGPKDGIDLIVAAAQELPEVNFILLGDGESKLANKRRAHELGLQNIRFLDPVSKTELPAFLKACDLGLHVVAPLKVFDLGMSPNKLFDYFAAGLPVVSNARYALRNVAADDQVGVFVDSGELVAGIRAVLGASGQTLARWSRTGQELLRQTYSRQASAQALEEVLVQCLR